MSVKPIPEGYHSVSPYITVQDSAKAIDFYKRAFGATEHARMQGPDGKIVHAEIKIGDSIVMLADESAMNECKSPQSVRGTTVNLFLYVSDVDSVFSRAVAAGAKSIAQPQDMFWGDRYGKLTDPFGHSWSLATHKEDVTHEEMKKRSEAFFAKPAAQKTRTA